MKQSVRFVLILVLCLALSISGVLVGVPATGSRYGYLDTTATVWR